MRIISLFVFLHLSVLVMAEVDFRKVNNLVGTTINNPYFIELLNNEDRKIVKYSIAVNKCKVVIGYEQYLLIEDGVIKKFVNDKADDWDDNFFDDRWGIKRLYKEMRKTDKSYPKTPKHEIGKYVYITKVVDGLNVYLTYKYRSINAEYTKYRMVLTNYIISPVDENSRLGKLEPPPKVYEAILGQNGSNLKNWICANFSTKVSPEFISNNFLPVNIKKDYDETPRFDQGDYYAHHYIAKGDYFLSIDASTLIRLENDTIKGIGFYPGKIETDIFPGFNISTSCYDLKNRYGELDTYMRDDDEYYIRTKNLEIRFAYDGWWDKFRMIWINQYFSNSRLICSEEFPFRSHKKAYCFSGNCENGYGSKMSNKGVLSTGYWEGGEPVDTHIEQYRYSVEKKEYHPSAENRKWLEGLKQKEEEMEAEWQERIKNIEGVPEEINNQLHDNLFYYYDFRVVTVEAGKTEYVFFKIPPNYHIGVTAITEKNLTIDMEISYEGFIAYNQINNDYYAFAMTKQYFVDDEDTQADITITIDNSWSSKDKFPVLLYFYKRKH